MDREGGSTLADMDPQFYAVVVKALLVHTARWNGNHELLKEICGPADRRRHVERRENSSRSWLRRAGCCRGPRMRAAPRNTGRLRNHPAGKRAELPHPVAGLPDASRTPRSLTVTLAWFAHKVRTPELPLRPPRTATGHAPLQVLGVERLRGHPLIPPSSAAASFMENFEGTSAVRASTRTSGAPGLVPGGCRRP